MNQDRSTIHIASGHIASGQIASGRCRLFSATLSLYVLLGLPVEAVAGPVIISNVPDLSQHVNNFNNYCGPTAAANVVYYFNQTGGNTNLGGTPGVDANATGLIGGNTPVITPPPDGFPVPGSLADLMGTSLVNGTTPQKLRDGLDSYLEDKHDGIGGGNDWDTQLLLTQSAGGSLSGNDFWLELQSSIDVGKGVILLIDWAGNAPQETEDQQYEEPETPGQGASSSIGHAVTMVDYAPGTFTPARIFFHDPGTNLSSGHDWTPASPESSLLTVNATNLSASFGLPGFQATGTIYGAVTTIPEPNSLVLFSLSGLLLLLRFHRASNFSA